MLALSIRQPYAELILRGVKTIEYRTVRTTKIGERFYIYVPRKWADAPGISALDETALTPALSHPRKLERENLPRGVIGGSAVISQCTKGDDYFEWHLTDVKRYKRQRTPTRQPQPVWFQPFKKAA